MNGVLVNPCKGFTIDFTVNPPNSGRVGHQLVTLKIDVICRVRIVYVHSDCDDDNGDGEEDKNNDDDNECDQCYV